MLYVFPDTNFILHFRQISDITAEDLGLSVDFTWVVVGQVMRELDIRKGTGDRTLRKRAAKAALAFEKAKTGEEPLPDGRGFDVHFRTRKFDMDAHNLLEGEGDHKVIADILDFMERHSGDDVLLLSNDSTMRLTANEYGIRTIRPSDDLKRPEIEDERDEQIRLLEEKYAKIAQTQPLLTFAFAEESKEMTTTVSSFREQEFEDLFERATQPEPEPQIDPLYGEFGANILAMISRPNAEYDEQMKKYASRFRSYFLVTWVQRFRTVEVAPIIYSKNGVEASGVNVKIEFETNAEVIKELPEPFVSPEKPKRMISFLPGAFSSPLGGSVEDITHRSWLPRNVEVNPRSPSVSHLNNIATVRYGLFRVAQDAETPLDPFYIVFENGLPPPKVIRLSFEVRAKNMNTVVRGHLLIKFSTIEQPVPAYFMMDEEV